MKRSSRHSRQRRYERRYERVKSRDEMIRRIGLLIILILGTFTVTGNIKPTEAQINEANVPDITVSITSDYVNNVIEITSEPTSQGWEEQVRDGIETISYGGYSSLIKRKLPSDMYNNINFSTFFPYEDGRCISNKSAPAYGIVHGSGVYVDEFGLYRNPVADETFKVDGKDDIIVALGNYYKPKGTVGQRFLVVTTTGRFTIIVGDEKDDRHTDTYNMFSRHGKYAGLIEFIIDSASLPPSVRKTGSVKASGLPGIDGDIVALYQIV